MQLHQFSIRKLLIVIALVASYFPYEKSYHKWLARNHGCSYVEAVLTSQLREGDSLELVASHFDSIRLLETTTDSEYLSNLSAICSRKGFAILEDDEFYRLAVASGPGAYLQFRNRRLVNIWNSAWIDSRKYPSQRVSSFARFVFMAIYISIFVSVLVTDSLIQYWARHKSGKDARHPARPTHHPTCEPNTAVQRS